MLDKIILFFCLFKLATVNRSSRLGCYFCNDIVAATNSQRDRSMDQQCTVTRPGLSFIASALAVEMMVALLHSPCGGLSHPAMNTDDITTTGASAESETEGITPIPHQIRGSLSNYSQILPQVFQNVLVLFVIGSITHDIIFLYADASIFLLHGMFSTCGDSVSIAWIRVCPGGL